MWKDQEAQKAHAKKIALKGGLTTKKRGKKYYSEIGKKGAAAKKLKRA
jgi:general stress protein YciG